MFRYILVVLVVLLVFPLPGAAQSGAVVNEGTARYDGLDVSIAGADGPRRLHLAFEAQCMDAKSAQQAISPQAREAVLLLLRGKTVADLLPPSGKNKLKVELIDGLNRVIGAPRVVRVFFLQFVII